MTLSPGNIRKIFELRDASRSVRTIAKELKTGKSTVQRYLKKGKEAALSQTSMPRGKKKTIGRREAIKTDTRETERYEEDSLSWMLDIIISEVTKRRERPAIVRMVEQHYQDSDYGMSKLSEALDLANIRANDQWFILKNWGDYVGVNADKYLKIKGGNSNYY